MGYRRLKVPGKSRPAGKSGPVATALQYEPGVDAAPRVVASGQWKMAEQILALAREHNIPLYDDPLLAAALSTINIGDEIPPELYLVVAEVLAYIYRVTGKRATRP